MRTDARMRIGFWRGHGGWLGGAAAGFVVALAFSLIFFSPAAAAIICPPCFGFERIERAVFVDRAMTPDVRAQAIKAIGQARERVRKFYGERRSDPTILICATEECYRRLDGGGSRGQAFYDFALMLSPSAISETIAAHEMSHIELHTRVGVWRVFREAIPVWFDEGLAVVVSDDPRYLAPDGDRCRVRNDNPLPETLREWLRAGDPDRRYAAAACRVNAWVKAKGGPAAVVTLADRLADGADFNEAAR